MRVLWLTNDLPPRAGGIEQFVVNLVRRTHPRSTVVIGPHRDGAEGWDRRQNFRVLRVPTSTVLPTPRVLSWTRAVAARHRPEVVVLGATWPLGELASALGRDPGVPVVGLTHGLEAGLGHVGLGWLVRRATRGLAAVTTISDYTTQRLSGHLAARRTRRLAPGVDVERFSPRVDGRPFRRRWGLPADGVIVGCISRLVRRKGQDRLLDAWPRVAERHPDAWLVIVGDGPLLDGFRRRARHRDRVVVTGQVADADLPTAYAALDLFAMPCRTRLYGLDVEGLGMVYLEAQASGVPVIVGDSGGAPESIDPHATGLVVDGRDGSQIIAALDTLVSDGARRRRMGREARVWVQQHWAWTTVAARFADLLAAVAADARGPESA